MSQSLGTGGPRARNVRPFLRGTGNPHKFWITEQDHPFSYCQGTPPQSRTHWVLWSTTHLQSLHWHGCGATPIIQQGSLPMEQRTANTGLTTHQEQCVKPLGAFMMFSKRNQNGPFLECKPKSMSQRRQRMPQSLGTGGPRARNVRPFQSETGNPNFWITWQDGRFS